MKPSDEKLRALAHAAVTALAEQPGLQLLDRQQALDIIRRSIRAVMVVHDEIDAAVRGKIRSLSRPVAPGSRQFSELYAHYSEQESRRRGF